ncbi:mycofactocin biosynthesis peptidyl-dipeptidase MftE [Nocardioides mangrovicus]|uniref:Mycofactocin biosynthesis peptidyl-dipeptidase MftE n=1 Tax=Nocardioides mangrovicus TaxID=2478913 RepID=A0A3L8NYT9_9ACTN|nr:mycofactocin biosynthesis peptidyl-dipeptidase MftE [Nocardioides mangrovicus]RLV48340.1 mycofactocin biosynthesis peptidyl-dipeptidase MftE [Nocardioides mangrovicus]
MLADLAWREVPDAPLVLVPVGSLEQHGPHLPLETDTLIATAVAERAAARVDAVLAPALGYGSSGEHQSFAGTVSIGTEALTHLLVELTRSLATWAGRVVYVNGHGGNLSALKEAVGQLQVEGHDVDWVPCATEPPHLPGADLHAGLTETSLLLHLCPERVRTDRLEVGNAAPLREILPAMIEGGVAAVSANGVLGDPRAASAEQGEQILAELVDRVVEALVEAL